MLDFEKDQKTTIGTMIAAGLLMILCYFHMMSWGKYAGAIVPLEIKSVLGFANVSDYRQMAEACAETGHYACTEQSYLYEYGLSRDPEVVGELAAFQLKVENYKAASDTFIKYYQLSGKNPAYAYFYGQTLEKLGEKKRAERAYRLSIDQNPEKLSVNATTALVRLLMTEGKLKEAYKVVSAFHASAENAKGYLNEEAKVLNAKFGEPKAVAPTRSIASVGKSEKRGKSVIKF